MITLVVFSMDRALQCDSLLRSVVDHCTGLDRVVVLAKASSDLHIEAYRTLRALGEYDELTVNGAEGGLPLGEDIFQAVNDSQHTVLAVDDQLFYAPSDFAWAVEEMRLNDAFVWSWRLGHKPGVTQVLTGRGADYWMCPPRVADFDYAYLFHSDGALYRTEDYVAKLDRYLPDWRTGKYIPNDFEGAVAGRLAEWNSSAGVHLGPRDPTCITWQINKEQSTRRKQYGSPWHETTETALDALAEAYLAGKRVDNQALYADTSWTTRFNPPGVRPTHVWACEESSRFYTSMIR